MMTKIRYKLRFPTSVYAAEEIGNTLYVGGSIWDRRKILYTKEIAKKAKGVLFILKNQQPDKVIFFSHMVYSIVNLPNKLLFVGCKDAKGAFNLVNRKGEIIKQKDDKIGKGVYNAIYSKKEIICTTRSGKLVSIDTKLNIQKKLQLTKARLWSLDSDNKNIYAGNYDGTLYIVDRAKFKLIGKINLKALYPGDKRLKKGFGPSLWGLKSIANNIITGNRWGDIAIFNKKLQLKKRISVKEDISCIEQLSKQILLIGTRYGKLYALNLKTSKLSKITQIRPVLQEENAVWGMAQAKNGVLVCFADGFVCKIR